jgi:hypothetical protein
MRKRVIANVVRTLPSMMPRHVNTGHALAPLYTPLSITSISYAVQKLRRAWSQRNAEFTSAVRTAAHLAHASMLREVAAWRTTEARNGAAAREACAASATKVMARNKDDRRAYAVAARGRVARQAGRTAARGSALKAGAALAAEGRLVRDTDRYKGMQRCEADMQHAARERWLHGLIVREHSSAMKKGKQEQRAVQAAAVRATGYTQEVHDAQAAMWQEQRLQVGQQRDARDAGQKLVGPAGGLWGAAVPWESVREELPVALVGVAAENRSEGVRWHHVAFRGMRISACKVLCGSMNRWAFRLESGNTPLQCVTDVLCHNVWHNMRQSHGGRVGCESTPMVHINEPCHAEWGRGRTDGVHGRTTTDVRQFHDHHHWKRPLPRRQGRVWPIRRHPAHRVRLGPGTIARAGATGGDGRRHILARNAAAPAARCFLTSLAPLQQKRWKSGTLGCHGCQVTQRRSLSLEGATWRALGLQSVQPCWQYLDGGWRVHMPL